MARRTPALLSPEELSALHGPGPDIDNLAALGRLGGLGGLESGLRTSLESGLDACETSLDRGVPGKAEAARPRPPDAALFAERRRRFLDNQLPTKRQPTFVQLLWRSYNDPALFLLTAAAVASLAVDLYQTLGTAHSAANPPVEWVQGVAILVAILVIVLVSSVNDWGKQRQFRKLSRRQLQRDIKVVRSAALRLIPISELVVGDVAQLEPGDVVPADGVLISGQNLSCDEAAVTGESDLVLKTPGHAALAALSSSEPPRRSLLDPFLRSGTRVLDGVGTFLVTATGINSTYGQVLASVRDEPEPTPLQVRLTAVTKVIAHAGGFFALFLFVVLFVKFLARLPYDAGTPVAKGRDFVSIVIIAVTVLVIAVPEGLPLAVTLSLAIASIRMMKDNNLVRQLKACETMGNATDVCSDKTGTLTQNRMTVVNCTVGADMQFHDPALAPNLPDSRSATVQGTGNSPARLEQVALKLAPDVKFMLRQSISLNSMAFEARDAPAFVGSSTESALLHFARRHLAMGPVGSERSAAGVIQLIPFNAARQCMATVVRLPGSNTRCRVLVKGASEILLSRCSTVIRDPKRGCQVTEMTSQARQGLSDTIDSYAGHALRTITLAFRDLDLDHTEYVTSRGGADDTQTHWNLDSLVHDLSFICLFGIHDAIRPGVPQAVEACGEAGITVRMVTGDNVQTARAVATHCGILSYSRGDLSMEGLEFRAMSDVQAMEMLPRLKVLARSSPQDKQRLVALLKEMGRTVAVTGDGTNDVAALSTADVSFAMGGNSGTEVAREASSIILTNDDFTSIIRAILWGRAINDSER
ncbi:hypothetical protein CDD83_1596 [Cordyceps sp. RAO-2017]|nr:hypothetical protein CDD83_1596 [Cordyceps sp. RAO-2017]